ncbi:endoribonuclease L-PSP [Nonomuraea polychroma]|uniref:Endoribonuclease L-PSP n=1 Tax=Nonomuraea polychroma TaxID=46176 RepID=A0A438LZM9_9ACTN|nr:Rid family hydrolase [Nonomuraea polychroma]RVX38698.1 endoribonuclease L-PSP [Nonomuraea polychroma]
MKIRTAALAAAAVLVLTSGTAAAATWWSPQPTEVKPFLPAGTTNPAIADGVALGKLVATYTASGLGPAAANPAAPADSPERYVDFPGGSLPPGVTITEAQALNVLKRIKANLAAAGLGLGDVVSMRAYLEKPPGAAEADFAGWNRAYRQFFANVDLATGKPVPVPLGTAPPAPPMEVNAARPARVTLEIANLPVAGWLVEVEVVAAYQR